MKSFRDLSAARRALSHHLGSETVARLHKSELWRDVVIMLVLPSLTVGLMLAIGRLPFGVAKVACFIAQGFVFQWYLFLVHDLFLHRRVGGRYHAVLGFLYFVPLLFSYTWFAAFHTQHHKHLGTAKDSEGYKQDLDMRWKRLLFLTVPGVKLAMARKFKPANPTEPDESALMATPEERKRIKVEQWILRVWWYAMIVGAFFSHTIAFGYVLPFLLVTPLVSMTRILLEHGEANPDNDFHTGTYYRLGPISRWVFASSGDTHVIHHLFQGIPLYKCKEAANLSHDFLVAHGVVEQTSLARLLYGFLVENQPHRKLWRRPERVPAADAVSANVGAPAN